MMARLLFLRPLSFPVFFWFDVLVAGVWSGVSTGGDIENAGIGHTSLLPFCLECF